MRTAIIITGVLLFATPVVAGGIEITFGAPPPLVEIDNDVQVVPDIDEEVFFVDGAYWFQDDGVWYRSYSWQGGWAPVQYAYVPGPLFGVRHGHYRHWHPHNYRGPAAVYYRHRGPEYRRAPQRQVYVAPPRPVYRAQPQQQQQQRPVYRAAPARQAPAPARPTPQQQHAPQRGGPDRGSPGGGNAPRR